MDLKLDPRHQICKEIRSPEPVFCTLCCAVVVVVLAARLSVPAEAYGLSSGLALGAFWGCSGFPSGCLVALRVFCRGGLRRCAVKR